MRRVGTVHTMSGGRVLPPRLLAFVCVVALLAICSVCLGQAYVPGEVLVKFRAGTPASTAAAADRAIGAQSIRTFGTIGVRHVRLGQGIDVPAALRAYERNPNVVYAEPNYIVYAQATVPNDPYFNALWGLHNTGQTGGTADADIDAPEAWDVTKGAQDLIVAVIDTGVDYTHEDLAANMWVNTAEAGGQPGVDDDANGYVDDIHGYDFCNGDSDPMDDYGHGTHCSGTIGAVGNNGVGVAGVNWEAHIMGLKFLNSEGMGSTSDAISCVEYATMMKTVGGYPIAVLSNSWGGGGYSQALYDAIAAAGAADILFVASAGNSGRNTDTSPQYPACYDLDNIISVAATDHKDQLASWSNYGAQSVDLAAPGVDVYSTTPGNSYAYMSGTSMACPHVAGAAALLKAYTGETALEVKARMLSAVDVMTWRYKGKTKTTLGGGRLNLYNALPPANRPPVAANDSYSTNQDTPLAVAAPGVLGNDTDPDGDPLIALLGNGPSHGTLDLGAYGSFTYTPAPGFTGTDTFTYTAFDGTYDSNVATVTVAVMGQTGAVAGTVYDTRGKVVSKATVTAYDEGGTPVASTSTNGTGRYTLSNLPAGLYRLEASKGNLWGEYQSVQVVGGQTTPGIDIMVQ